MSGCRSPWRPPTPVSALIHAATMVNAGPFLLVRMSPLVLLAPSAMVVIAVIGALTALYGALVALTQSDIKKAAGVFDHQPDRLHDLRVRRRAFSAAVFHLLAHGFLKGYLFLSTGSALGAAGGHGHGEAAVPATRVRPLALGALLLAVIPTVVLFAGRTSASGARSSFPRRGPRFGRSDWRRSS